jgi:hypothetical protein
LNLEVSTASPCGEIPNGSLDDGTRVCVAKKSAEPPCVVEVAMPRVLLDVDCKTAGDVVAVANPLEAVKLDPIPDEENIFEPLYSLDGLGIEEMASIRRTRLKPEASEDEDGEDRLRSTREAVGSGFMLVNCTGFTNFKPFEGVDKCVSFEW